MPLTEERQQRSLRMAEVIDAYRVFPRTFLTIAFLSYFWLTAKSWMWYTALDFATIDWTNLAALTAFPLGLLTGLATMLKSMYIDYQNSGMDWTTRRKIIEEFKQKDK
jgi:hypothetical protein